MLCMTIYKQGQTVLVPFPFSDLTKSKKRPALVISANWYNKSKSDCILSAITTTRHKNITRDEYLIRGLEVQQAGLFDSSTIKCGHLFTISQSLIIKSLGTLPQGTLKNILLRVQGVFTE